VFRLGGDGLEVEIARTVVAGKVVHDAAAA
jgi:hypothetical protein